MFAEAPNTLTKHLDLVSAEVCANLHCTCDGPAGPRRHGEGVENEEQGIVTASNSAGG